MQYFPVFLDVRNEPVLVVGGGEVAERKVRLLHKAGAEVHIVARALNDALQAQAESGTVRWRARRFEVDQLEGARLVFAATDDEALNAHVHEAAEARGIPVNVVDDRARCRFITPAIVDRDPVQVAISSAGASPVLARRLRASIETLLPTGLGRVAAAAGRLRTRAARLPLALRRRTWDRLLAPAQVQVLSRLPEAAIETRLRAGLAGAEAGKTPGKVILVGAGPGRADLLTLRALQVLGEADVILHDRLVPAEILDMARRDAEFIDVGKRCGQASTRQEDIHELLLTHARRGEVVVRLKGGDPFVFGRGGEELEALRDEGIDYEVVPGVTAAAGCAAFAGIPLTHRDHAQSLTLVTGHPAADTPPPDWGSIAGPGRTAAVYMGARQAQRIRRELLDAGIEPGLPVALVADGTLETQQVLHGTVAELPALADALHRGAPALMVIGDVAALGDKLTWFQGSAHAPALRRQAA